MGKAIVSLLIIKTIEESIVQTVFWNHL